MNIHEIELDLADFFSSLRIIFCIIVWQKYKPFLSPPLSCVWISFVYSLKKLESFSPLANWNGVPCVEICTFQTKVFHPRIIKNERPALQGILFNHKHCAATRKKRDSSLSYMHFGTVNLENKIRHLNLSLTSDVYYNYPGRDALKELKKCWAEKLSGLEVVSIPSHYPLQDGSCLNSIKGQEISKTMAIRTHIGIPNYLRSTYANG